MPTPGWVVVDSSDTTRIDYKGDWELRGNSRADYMGTLYRTQNNASTATFKFNGTSVQVYGNWPPDTPSTSRYILDEKDPVFYTTPKVSSPTHQQLFYASPPLKDGLHTLVMQPTINGPHFYIDFIQYTSRTPTSRGPNSPGRIVGGVIGGVATLSVLFALLFLFFRRRKRSRYHDDSGIIMTGTSSVISTLSLRGTPDDRTPMPFVLPTRSNVTRFTGKSGVHPVSSTASPTLTSTSVPFHAYTWSGNRESNQALESTGRRDWDTASIQSAQRQELPPAYEERAENIQR